MYTEEKNIYHFLIFICVLVASLLSYFFYSILKYHKRDLKDKLEIIYGKDGILEEEKKRIGRELHDGVSSSLAGIKLMIESLQVQTEKDQKKVHIVSTHLDTALTNIRSILTGLMEVNLRNKTLTDVLIEYFEKFNTNMTEHQLFLDYEFNCTVEFEPEKANHLYRIVQEVITNTQKHSNARILKVTMNKQDQHMEIIFRDNGAGFNMDEVMVNKTGIGLNNIKYRTEILKGQFDIHSEKNKGTEIKLTIPL